MDIFNCGPLSSVHRCCADLKAKVVIISMVKRNGVSKKIPMVEINKQKL